MIDSLVRVYPAAYRTAYGQEIVDVHRAMTADLPRAARLRADADLVAHALRVRLGLDSASPAGRLFARAAPFALAAGAVTCGLRLTAHYAAAVVPPNPVGVFAALEGAWALSLLLSLLVCVGAIIALTGRWSWGAGVAVCGLLGTAAQWAVAPVPGEGAAGPLSALLAAAVVLACPPDRRGDGRLCRVAGATAAVAWFPVVVVDTRAFGVTTDYGVWPILVFVLTGAVLALRARSSGLYEIGAMAMASPPLAAYAYTGVWGDPRPVLGMFLLLPAAVALTAIRQAARR